MERVRLNLGRGAISTLLSPVPLSIPFSPTLSPLNPVTIGPAFCSSFHNILIRFPAPSLPHDLATCTLGFLPFATAAIAECDVEYECKENIKYEVQLDCVLQGI